jgi:hypothetical protein
VERLIRLPLLLVARFSTMAVMRLGLTRAASSKFTYGYAVIAGKAPA